MKSPPQWTPLQLARQFGLRRTWAQASKELSWYREKLPAAIPAGALTLSQLCEVEPLTRAQYEINMNEWTGNGGRLPDSLVFTGGTTGRPLMVFGHAIPRAIGAAEHGVPDTRPLMIVTSGGAQGSRPFNPADLGALVVPLRSHAGYEACLALLARHFNFEGFETRVSELALPLPAVKKLVHLVLEKKLDTSLFALERVSTYSAYLSARWRELIERVLGAKVVDHFGMTEIMSARAAECEYCGFYHYGDNAIHEVLNGSRPTCREGAQGELLLTSLLSRHDSNMPVLRYRTGDIVQVGPFCSAHGDIGFRPKGRADQTVCLRVDDADTYPVLGGDVLEAIDLHPWIARIANLRHAGVTRTEDEAFSKWRLSVDETATPPAVVITVELNTGTALFGQEWRDFQAYVKATMEQVNPAFAAAEHAGRFRFVLEAVPPGAMAERDVNRY